MVYDRVSIESFHQSLESFQYSNETAITEAIKGTSSEKLFQELSLKTLKSRHWLRKLSLLYKLIKEKPPGYLFQLIPENNTPYTMGRIQKTQIPFFKKKKKFNKISFFPAVITEWNNLDVNIRNSASIVFKKVTLNLISLEPSQGFTVGSSERSKFVTRKRLRMSHLADRKFRHSFQDYGNPICSCGQETETSNHFLLYCPTYQCARHTLVQKGNKIDSAILKQNDQVITKLLLFGNDKLKAVQQNSY